MDSILDERLHDFQNLGSKHHNRGGSVSNFSVLGPGDVDHGGGGREDDVEKLQNRSSVVWDSRGAFGVDDEFVESTGSQGGTDAVSDDLF